jgi:phage tail sheath protein FI
LNICYPRIFDDSLTAAQINPSVAATVFGHRRGPLGAHMVTSIKNRKKWYGLNDPTWGHGVDAADAYLLQGSQLWMDRVVSADATYGLGLISNNKIGGVAAGTSYTPIPAGSQVPFSEVNRDVVDLEFAGLFGAGHSAAVTVNSVVGTTVPYSTNHNFTMAMIAQSIQNVLDGLAGGGYAYLVPVGTNDSVIRIIGPQAITLAVSATTTGSSAPTVVTPREADWICFVVAQNPGAWSGQNNGLGYSGVAVGITNVDVGTSKRQTISFSGTILTGMTINMTANGTTINVPWAVNNNQTLLNFASAYNAAFPGGLATVVHSSTASNNLQVVLVSPSPDNSLVISALTVTGGSTPPTVTYVTTLSPVPTNGTFNFVVYENANFVRPDELFFCTFNSGVDGLGNPTGMDYVINGIDNVNQTAPAIPPSTRIAVKLNPLFSGVVNGSTNPTNSNYPRYLAGGLDGSVPSTQQIVTGWDDFSNAERITVRILINAGYANAPVHQKMMAIAARRMDCFCVLDTPANLQNPEDAANYRQTQMSVDSFWGAIYSPDILIYDQDLGARRYVPPSGMVAGQYAYNDRVASQFFAPAGLTRGILANALGCRFVYEEGDRDTLSEAQVNAIRFINDAWTIWGEYTLQAAMSSLQSVPVVRMVITVVTEASSVVAYSVFEPNNEYTWHRVRARMNDILQPIEDGNGLTDYLVQCDKTNNTPDVVQQRVMKVALWLKPVLCALYVALDLVITRQNATFTVEETAFKNQF